MDEPLVEVESLFQKTLRALEDVEASQVEVRDNLVKKIQEMLLIIAESKKKIMVRSTKGKEIADKVLENASKLYQAARRNHRDEDALESLESSLKRVEDSIQKLKIYWKSFEYATT